MFILQNWIKLIPYTLIDVQIWEWFSSLKMFILAMCWRLQLRTAYLGQLGSYFAVTTFSYYIIFIHTIKFDVFWCMYLCKWHNASLLAAHHSPIKLIATSMKCTEFEMRKYVILYINVCVKRWLLEYLPSTFVSSHKSLGSSGN